MKQTIQNQSDLPIPSLNYIPPDIYCAQDYEDLAANFIPASRLAYLAGGSGFDRTLKQNKTAFENYAITPRLFKDVTNASCATSLLYQELQAPIMLAPVAFQALVHQDAEVATAKGATAVDTTMIASTLSSKSLEEIAAVTKKNKWFQLYFQPKQADTDALVKRAIQAGYKAIVVTTDAILQVPSIRAMRAGFAMPERIKAANLAHQTPVAQAEATATQSRVFLSYMQQAVTKEMIQNLVETCPLPVLVKGVLHPDDATALKEMGVAGIVVSNHGGRSLDTAPTSISVLPSIRQVVGESYPLLLDSGIRSGDDIFKAIALGADAVLIGRLQIYALSVAGPLGVAHMLKMLKEELELTMAMAGCRNLADIRSSQIRQF